MPGYFITGTDTSVGKTNIALALMRVFKNNGHRVTCMKPVSAGCARTSAGLRNDDAMRLISESSTELSYDDVNPYAYEPAIAPHIAAQMLGENIRLDVISEAFEKISSGSNMVIVEGAGGWLVPITKTQSMADVAKALQLPIILVVGMRLGCLNHALLSVASIENKGLGLPII